MSPNDKSTPDMSNSAVFEFNKIIYPSKIFSVHKYSDKLDLRHNGSIAALTDPRWLAYTQITDKAVSVIKDPAIARYQDRLLKEAIAGISANGVDIDYIEIGLDLTLTDVNKLISDNVLKGLDPNTVPPEAKIDNITEVKVGREARLKAEKVQLGTKNSFYKKDDKKPYFTHKFRLTVDNDSYRFMDIYIANPLELRNKNKPTKPLYNCVIEFIPTRLSPALISFMLYQFVSSIERRRYDQLIKHALLLRIDAGYTMHGLSQLFCFPLRAKNKVRVSECLPANKSIVETTYLGERKKSESHDIVYDKVLKEFKFFIQDALSNLNCDFSQIADHIDGIDQLFSQNAASARLEARQFFKRKQSIPLALLETVDPKIHRVMFLRPKAVAELDKDQVVSLIGDKTVGEVQAVRLSLREKHNRKGNKYLYKFDEAQVIEAFQSKLSDMKAALGTPIKLIEDKPLGNYQRATLKAKRYFAPLAKKLRNKQSSKTEIVKSEGRCIYVEGTPGSGKTEIIVERVKHLIDTANAPSSICVLAFTNDAAKEFAGRLDKAKLLKDGMFVGTFSSWCNQFLNKIDPATVLTMPESIEIIEDCIPKKSRLLRHFEKQDVARYTYSILSYSVNFDDRDYDKCIEKTATMLSPFSSDIKKTIKAYVAWKRKNDKRDFNDMLRQMDKRLKQLKKDGRLDSLSIPRYVFLDEAQDTNDTQLGILETLAFTGCNFFFVGDPAQSMYGFRGATNFSKKLLEAYFGTCEDYYLVKNQRSKAPIVNLANNLRFKINKNYSQSLIVHKDGLLPRFVEFSVIKDGIAYVMSDLEKLLENGESSVLILCRYNAHVKLVKKALEQLKSKSSVSVFPEIEDVCMTYHKSKGKQAEHCYVFDPTFHNYSLGTVKEELCNTYVAFTRAKTHLTIIASKAGHAMYGTTDNKEVSESIFAKLPEKLMQFIG
jgi:DNA helicase-2/ATP-dependent DNA helicase PcrA